MVKQASEERRGFLRARRVLSIQYKLVKGQRGNADSVWGLSTTYDMSSGGVAFYTDREYHKDDILNIHIIMSGILDIYKGCGKVIRVNRRKTGSCFLTAVKFIERAQARRSSVKTIQPARKSRVREGL